MRKLEGLKPERVFYYFEEISKIPRCTHNEKEISDYLKSVGESLNLETIQDEYMNIIIRKPASEGYEKAEPIILQGHMDMVCEKENESDHDFSKDGIDLLIDGDFISGNKTTLGADNGIAVAMGLAILEDDSLKHPAIELLLTSAEEIDMRGAIGLSEEVLRGRRMLNIDTEEEGTLILGSAGGELLEISLDLDYIDVVDTRRVKLFLSGLQGGHSGMEIDRDLANGNKILAEILEDLSKNLDINIVDIDGGTKDNAIPRVGEVEFVVANEDLGEFRKHVEEIIDRIKEENKTREENLEISYEIEESLYAGRAVGNTSDIIDLIKKIHTGPYSFIEGDEKLVESSANLAIVKIRDDKFRLSLSCRSSSGEKARELREETIKIVDEKNASWEIGNSYPAWEFEKDSKLKDVAVETYRQMEDKKMHTTVIHAGLECGVIKSKYPDMEIVSFGPDIYGAHLPGEKLSISSTERVYEYLIKLLENLL